MAETRINVCPLDALEEQIEQCRASHVVSLINGQMMPETPVSINPERHLKLAMNDITSPMQGLVTPSRTHVEQLVAFVEGWDQRDDMVIHCWAGISRSTAAAYIAMCVLHPDRDEAEIAADLRRRSPEATPNQLLVRTADNLLGRQGRMEQAIIRMGRGAFASRGTPWSFTLAEEGAT